MARVPLFADGSYQNQSSRADSQGSVNMYPETDPTIKRTVLVGTPGLSLFATLATSPVRGIWIGEDRMFVVSGSKLYEVFQNGTSTQRGDVGSDGLPVQIFPNGNQLGIVSNGFLWCDSGAGPVQITFPGSSGTASTTGFDGLVYWESGDLFDNTLIGRALTLNGTVHGVVSQVLNPQLLMASVTPPSLTNVSYSVPGGDVTATSGTMYDGYGVVAVPSSAQINASNLYDFSTWDPTVFALKEGYPDHIQAVIANRTILHILGKQTLELWTDSGGVDFPFTRIPGMVLQIGTIAKNSVDRLEDGIALLGTDSRGGPVAYLVAGYQWERISTPAVEALWQEYSTIDDAVAFSYADGGHNFYQLSFPTADSTWCYDRLERQWHQRGYWDGAVFHRTRSAFHGYVWGGHYTGDWNSGNIYHMSRDFYTDAGQPILRQRTATNQTDENKLTAYSDLTLDIQPGEIANPQFTFDYSIDGGVTFRGARVLTGGAINDTLHRFTERRLGTSRIRTFRITSTAAMRHVWIDAYVEAVNAANRMP